MCANKMTGWAQHTHQLKIINYNKEMMLVLDSKPLQVPWRVGGRTEQADTTYMVCCNCLDKAGVNYSIKQNMIHYYNISP